MSDAPRSRAWRWYVCILLLFATTINYLDRQTLSVTAKRIIGEFELSKEQYGNLEMGFGLAFAAGSLLFGFLADRLGVRWLYPMLLLAWSAAGYATAHMKTYDGLMLCRVLLGFFEAGHWPCALKTVQRIHERKDRALGNSLLQSGSSVGAILAPVVIQALLDRGYGWRYPFQLVAIVGSFWAFFWLASVRSRDLDAPPPEDSTGDAAAAGKTSLRTAAFRLAALMVMVSCINMSWQLLRAWMPLFLQEGRGYSEKHANYFTSAYYIATDLGVLTAGFLSLQLTRRGLSVHASRCWTFFVCSLLALLAVAASRLPQGWALLGCLLLVGFGLLGVFPSYYAFAQEITVKHQGLVTGILGVSAWVTVSIAQKSFGRYIDGTKSYDLGIALAGVFPLLSLLLLVVLWNVGARKERRSP